MAGEVYTSEQDREGIEAALRKAEEQAVDAARRMAPYWLAGAVQSVRQQAAAVQRRSVGRRMIDRIRTVWDGYDPADPFGKQRKAVWIVARKVMYVAGLPIESRRATKAYRALVAECEEHRPLWDLERELFRQACSLMQVELDKEGRDCE